MRDESSLIENTYSRTDPITIASIGKAILNAAKAAIGNKIKGFVTDKIKGILGINTTQEIAPVDLSQKALSEIRKIVKSEIQAALNEQWFQSNHLEAQQLLRDIQSLYDRYVAEEEVSNPLSTNILWQLYYKCNTLNEFTVFTGTGLNGTHADKYWLTIHTYALLVSIRYPILIEMHAKCLFLNKEQTVNDVKVMYNRLDKLQRSLYLYCSQNVTITNSIYPDYTYSVDTVWDRITGKSYVFFGPYQGGYSQAAYTLRYNLLNQHVNEFGNYYQFLAALKPLTDINNYTSSDFN
ncbi:MAG: hypothetical protein JXB88_06640 [Spirochaetales bacterium]|nr:hypothetical protein [Spirochaetales bacterium]